MNRNADYIPGRSAGPDIIRAVAIAGVLLLHSSSPVQESFTSPTLSWWAANVYFSASRYCVPLFIMLSGMLLLGKEEPASVFYRKRAARLVFAYLAWSVFYMAMRHAVGEKEFTASQIVRELATGQAFFHLWFIYMIAGIYLVTPFVRAALRRMSSPRTLLLALFAYTTAVWYFGLPRYVPLFTAYLFYFVFGYYAGALRTVRVNSGIAACIALAGAALGSYETYRLSLEHGSYVSMANEYTSPYAAVLSIGVFLLLSGLDPARIGVRLTKAAYYISIASYGTYMMHPVVLSVLQYNPHGLSGLGIGIDTLLVYPAVSIPAATALSLAICTALVLTMRRVPYMRNIV